uniref:short-chain dehydrogenase/reductase family 42E member 1-like n=1 Tax=Styela clava TaxID=7725 RepID=UPI001939A491|nr:short-chain dehydrogenase/reductase family 42E member 1-like [Styela clava]
MVDTTILERLNIRLDELPAKLEFKKGTNGHSRKLKFLVTGGCGYLGYELAAAIHGLGGHVTLLDLQIPPRIEKCLDDALCFIKGDVCKYDSVFEACKGVDCVFHVASFGMSGKDQLDKEKSYNVNVNGTKNVIRACKEVGVSKLIYTSSYNVVLGFQPIENGNDFVPYAPVEEMVDHYSKSKQLADKLVLAANETDIQGGGKLYTCCLRPAGIYGPLERRHMHRVASFINQGLILFSMGNAMVDWTHVNNLVQAHLLAVPGLSKASNRIAAGQAYFIADGNPVKVFDFLRPIFYGFGKIPPRYQLPATITYFFGFLMELLHLVLRPIYCFEPLLTRNEVLKMTIPHYQDMSRVMKELGYRPVKYSFADVVRLYMKENYPELEKKYSVYGEHLNTSQDSTTTSLSTISYQLLIILLSIIFILMIVPISNVLF